MHLSIETVIKMAFKNNSFTAGVTVAVIIVVLTSIILIFFCLHKKKISKPIKLQISDITHDSIVLEWTKPKKGGKHVTKPKYPGRPRHKPTFTLVTQNSISLTWHEPEYGADLVKRYNVLFCPTDNRQGEWKKLVVEGIYRFTCIDELVPETEYSFKVCPEGEFGMGPESDLSDPIKTNKILSKQMKELSERVSK